MGEQLCLFERHSPSPAETDKGNYSRALLPGSIPLPRVQFAPRQDPDGHPADRLRDRGPRSLTDSELLSLILQIDGPDAVHDQLGEIGLVGLAQLDQDFFHRSGWDEKRTASLLAAVELARRLARIRIPERQLMDRPDRVADYLTLRYQSDQEVMGALYMDVRRRLIAEREIFRGTLSQVTAAPRDIHSFSGTVEGSRQPGGAAPDHDEVVKAHLGLGLKPEPLG